MMRWHVILVFLALSACGASGAGIACANGGDLCASPAFLDAFREGQRSPDYAGRSPKLLALGSQAVPCLKSIARAPDSVESARACGENPRGCADWALAA